MRHWINAYDLDGVPFPELRARGWHGARRDVRSVGEALYVLNQHKAAGMGALLLVNAPPAEAGPLARDIVVSLAPLHSFAIEPGNEWDVDVEPLAAREAWDAVAGAAAVFAGVTVVTAGISSLSSTAQAWLRSALPPLPLWPGVVCGFHGYTSATFNAGNRRAELQQLRSIIGERRAWNTETGWHMASKAKPFPLCWQRQPGLTEDQVLENLLADVTVHREFGIEDYTTYQLRDGARDVAEDRFGIMAEDGRWKAQSTLPAVTP